MSQENLSENSRAQHGEDLALAELLNFQRGGIFVEAGAMDGEQFSNTWLFEKQLGWTGLLVEPNPELARQCTLKRPHSVVVNAALGRRAGVASLTVPENPAFATTRGNDHLQMRYQAHSVIEVRVRQVTLAEALRTHGFERVDLLVLDVEDAEHKVLAGAAIREFKPRVIMLERDQLRLGMLLRLVLSKYGFETRIVTNDVWVRDEATYARLKSILVLLRIAAAPTMRSWIRQGLRSTGILATARRARTRIISGRRVHHR